MASRRGILGALAVLLLAGCVTAYQPRGATGGYEEEKLADDTYRVSFFGNGNTPRGVVLKYFLYRCAELTLQRGYAYFELYAAERAGLPADARFVRTSAEAAPPPPFTVAQTYTITTWSASAIVRMYPGDVLAGAPTLYSAREVTGALGADVRSGTPSAELPSKFRGVEGKFPIMPAERARAPEPKSGQAPSGPVRLDDLKDLLPR